VSLDGTHLLVVITLVGGQLWSIAVEYDNHFTVGAGDRNQHLERTSQKCGA